MSIAPLTHREILPKKIVSSRGIAITVIIIVSVAIYANTLNNGFVYDDRPQILYNDLIKDIKYFPNAFTNSISTFADLPGVSNYYRPFMYITFMVEFYLFGPNPWGFHLVNIILNTLNTILVFFITLTLFNNLQTINNQAKAEKTTHFVSALAASIFFTLHPIHSEAVAWISAVPELLFTLFYLLSFYFHITKKQDRKMHILSATLFFLATFSKETALTLPLLIVAYDYLKIDRNLVKDWKKYVPYIVAIMLYAAIRIYVIGGITAEKHIDLSTYQWLINIPTLVIQYIGKLLLPVGLNALYVFHPVIFITEPKAFGSLLLTLLIGATLIILRKNKIVLICSVFIFIPLLPVLYLPGLSGAVFADRYLYLPSVGFVILLSYAVQQAWNIFRESKFLKAFLILLSLSLIVFYSTITINRISVWYDEYTLWSDTVKKSPDNASAHYNLGLALYTKGQIDTAMEELKEAIKIYPAYTDAHYNLGIIYQNNGLLKEAILEYREVLKHDPNSADVYYNLGLIYKRLSLLDQAILAFQEAIKITPDYKEALQEMGKTWHLKQLQK